MLTLVCIGTVAVWGRQIVQAGVTYEGAAVIADNVMPEATKIFESKTGIKFDVVGNLGCGAGMKALIEGKVQLIGLVSEPTPELKKIKPYFQTIGYDAIVIYVNEKNPVKNFTKEQIKDIFTGKITNWKEVGGKDAKIEYIVEGKTRGTRRVFKEKALDGVEYGVGVKEIDSPSGDVQYVSENEDAIAFHSIGYARAGAKYVSINGIEPSKENLISGAYLISRPMKLATVGLPKGDLKKFIDFMISDEGQRIVAKKFAPLKKK